VLEITDAMATQTPIKARARRGLIDELMRQRQQVIKRQQQRTAQLHHDRLLGRRECGAQLVRSVRTVLHVIAPPPFAHREFSWVVNKIQLNRAINPWLSREFLNAIALLAGPINAQDCLQYLFHSFKRTHWKLNRV